MASSSSSSPTAPLPLPITPVRGSTIDSTPPPQPLPPEDLQQPEPKEKEKECVHKTKTIQFLGRTTPIILQNDNGPCPLLAICNVLLLRNQLNLPDTGEVLQEKLLSLVAERLIDSNSNVDNKGAEYVENQQQNIADAIDSLPRLATGIDVNIKFRRTDDFEFTPECAIFDLLDIPLYHGWIVDPQDVDAADAIGSKSYNALMGELVALETQDMEGAQNNISGGDNIDFVAATTATLGVPSPSLSKSRSFADSPPAVTDQSFADSPPAVTVQSFADSPPAVTVQSFADSPPAVTDQQKLRKGDLEEEAELLRVLKLSETQTEALALTSASHKENMNEVKPYAISGQTPMPADSVDSSEGVLASADNIKADHSEAPPAKSSGSPSIEDKIMEAVKPISEEVVTMPLKGNAWNPTVPSSNEEAGEHNIDVCNDGKSIANQSINNDSLLSVSSGKDSVSVTEKYMASLKEHKSDHYTLTTHVSADNHSGNGTTELSSRSEENSGSDSLNGITQHTDAAESLTSVASSEPMYEGEDCILNQENTNFEDGEPVYEGEVILAESAGKVPVDDSGVRSKDSISPEQGELIKNFLKNSASQLTIYGLFCLQDGLKERELCVFFRNNHFCTMFKYNGELYLLATDQGYINQPDLVWEKLNEVNGDTLFMTGNFTEFKMDGNVNGTWDEQNAVASTADYLANYNAAQGGLDMNSDLQLAIALQQQEFEQQQQQQQQQPQQQPPNSQQSSIGASRLVTGPQVPRGRSPTSSTRPETKSKEKCIVM